MDAYDVIVIGTGSAACSAALRAAKGGLRVLAIEKSAKLGGTSAMSGSGVWIPANHIAAAQGVSDSKKEALDYLLAVAPPGWADKEVDRYRAFVENAPSTLKFISDNTPIEFRLIDEPDPYVEASGGKKYGRMLSPMPLSRRLVGKYAGKMRRSTLPHVFTYQENVNLDLYHRPFQAIFKMWPKLVWRWLNNAGAQGTALMTGLVKGCLDAGVTFRLATRALSLVQDDSGRIVGVEVESAGGRETLTANRGVVIASGGFEWNKEMRERHFPGPLDRIGTPMSNEGDGQRMAQAAGAQLDNMDQANVYVCLPTRYEGKRYGLPINFLYEPHSIVVNRHGKRFVSEAHFNIGEALDKRDADGNPINLPCYLVGDHRFLQSSFTFRWYASYERGWVKKADTIEELAVKLGLPAEDLKASIARWNSFCAKGIDEDFHRGEPAWERKKDGGKVRLYPIDKGPYVGLSVNRSIIGTKGGARTNEFGQVLREDGSIIPGLYAAGLAMSNPIGTRAVGAGTTLGPNLTWGFISAETILRQNQ
ncbi:FAD-binding protein [Rhizobium metallidurans]|uniref:3-oxosteroid 1-dehydrogenase n=1 Tax=Rhizobium metallidurans TaxID=1265931 RepID=A0A7W6GD41_9HYPH|nr:FAD-binding protein [Rhizobium metallidurans]MBB3966777.1 3-oxosteroid 1-dehydrogenase [Rhizobium metallidurans]